MAEVVGGHDGNSFFRPSREEDHFPFEGDEDQSQSRQSAQEQQEQDRHASEDQQRLTRIETNTSTSSRPLEATELGEIRRLSAESTSEGSISSGEYRTTSRHSGATAATTDSRERRNRQKKGKWIPEAVRRFWTRNVALEVPHKGNRDYFGNRSPPRNILRKWILADIEMGMGTALERTFLAYMRTAATFSIQGVLVAQLFRLQPSKSGASGRPTSPIRFRSVGIPLSVAYQTCAILVALMGAYRFWRQQNAIARGKVLVGGWELYGIGFLTLLAGVTLLSLAIALTAEIG